MFGTTRIEKSYKLARQQYADWGVDTESALKELEQISLSLHCWQGDDVAGFERPDAALSGGGIQVTGNYPGRARTPDELRSDIEQAYALIPGKHRLNLHAMYGEFGGQQVDRTEIGTEHFQGWVDWAKQQGIKLDFNATCFSHEKADAGFTLSHKDKEIRDFWIWHVRICREISAFMGRELGSTCIHNLWIPDGHKDIPADRWSPRARLKESLNTIYETPYKPEEMKDAIESKLFGIGSEAYVVGSHEFYLGYALKNGIIPCFDLGHFHPTESVSDKISAVMQFTEELLLHVSRPVRWDSDHVVILNDEVRSNAEEIVRGNAINRIYIALDFFDATMNRVGAWSIGARATLKSLLIALLTPFEKLRDYENQEKYFERLALTEMAKNLPFGLVWDYFCHQHDVPTGTSWINEIQEYEKRELDKRR